MLDQLKEHPVLFSRRHMVLTAVAAMGAATAVNDSTAAAGEMKISMNAVGYQDHPNGDKQCSVCEHFLPPSSCKIVEGTISPRGYCRIFAPRQSAAARKGESASKGGIFGTGYLTSASARPVVDSTCSAINSLTFG